MASKPFEILTDLQLQETVNAYAEHGSVKATASALGLTRATIDHRLRAAEKRKITVAIKGGVGFPAIPDDDIPVSEIIDLMVKRAGKRLDADKARRAQTITIKTSKPVVIAFVGDPHLDDDGCDWPTLRDHIELLRRPSVYAVNLGDVSNNWTGKLMRLYASQETSLKTARKLAKWFLTDAGINWIVWIMGNHDLWEQGDAILKAMRTTPVVMDDWSARFTLAFSNGVEVPIWASHDFPGSSQWNRMHGLMKAAMMRGGAAIYVAGHRHTAGMHWEPLEDQGASYWALRAKGYKAIDSHAARLGFGVTDEGQTVAAVINPSAAPSERVHAFKSLRAAIAFRDAIA